MKPIPNETNLRFSALLVLSACLIASGCASSRLTTARENFYLGRFRQAEANLSDATAEGRDRVLILMERAAARQAAGDYEGSARDWVQGTELAERLDYVSISKTSASMLVNDRVLNFLGAPYERTLAHAFAAKSYMALGRWDDAAVEARNIISDLENRNGFPEEPYSRYLAGFCMEMISDGEGAGLQYRTAASLLPGLGIDPATGRFRRNSPTPARELVCFVGIARGPLESGSWARNHVWGTAPYAMIFAAGRNLGRSYTFSNTRALMAATEKRAAVLRAAKTATRVAIKEAVSQAVEDENEVLGELIRLYLFALEASPQRRWETLPMWLQVARVPCPDGITEFDIVFHGEGGRIISRQTIKEPLVSNGRNYVSFVRVF